MLVLTRRRGEALILSGGIRIVVLDSDRRTVRLGIEAPPATTVQREELVSPVVAENRRASSRRERHAWVRALPLKGEPR